MAELTIEEKAKAYDEAIRKAKDMLFYKETRQEDILYLFPELKKKTTDKKQGEKKDLIDIPFGTDSELIEETITIPNGYVAMLESNKIHIKFLGHG